MSLKSIVASIITFLLISCHSKVQAQDFQKLYSLFEEIEFQELNSLHLFTLGRRHDLRPTALYPFKGKKIPKELHKLLNATLKKDYELTLYACMRFYINGTTEALIIREYQDSGSESILYFLVYNNKKEEITQSVFLSNCYGYEGGEGATDSWIIDIDNDGQKDILTRGYQVYHIGENADYHRNDTTYIHTWKNNKLVSTIVKDKITQEKLAEDFPYFKMTYLSRDTKKMLQDKKVIDSKKPENDKWCIIVSVDNSLENAEHECKKGINKVGYNNKYDLDARYFEIIEKDKKYYTILRGFRHKAKAEIALKELKKETFKTAFLVDQKERFGKLELIKYGLYKSVK